MSKQAIISQITARLAQLGIPFQIGQGTDLTIGAELVDAGWSTGSKKIVYEASVLLDDLARTAFIWEKTTETGSGFSGGYDGGSSFQSGKTLYRKVKSIQYGPDGRAYEINLDLGAISKSVKEAASQYGWKCKTVLSKAKAQYPAGYNAQPQPAPAPYPVYNAAAPVYSTPAAADSQMPRAAFCSQCGSPLGEAGRFCPACGHPTGQTEPAAAPMPAAVQSAPIYQPAAPAYQPAPVYQAAPAYQQAPAYQSAPAHKAHPGSKALPVIAYAILAVLVIGGLILAGTKLIGYLGKDDPQSTTTAASAATTQLKTTETSATDDDQSSKVSLGVNLDDLGNIINGQYFFDDGKYQFYSSFDVNCAAHIYRTDKATQTTVSIFDGFGWSLVVRDGWLYFSGNTGATIDGTYNLFRMKLDGSSLEKIYDGFSYGMSLYNNKLYYISKSSINAEDYAICRSNTDGSAREILVTDFNGYCIIYENMLYYSGKDGTFYRANPDGSQPAAILADKVNYAIIGNGKLIYTDTAGNIKIAGIDGQDSQLVLAAGALPVYSLNSNKDTIFYTVYDPTMDSSRYAYAYELYRIKFDGSGNQKIYQEYSYGTFINVVDGKVFTLDYAIDLSTGNMPAIARSMDFSGGGVTDLPR